MTDFGRRFDRFVDRGNVTAWDWRASGLTHDDNWHDLDCSLIVPAGATLILLQANIFDTSSGIYFFVRHPDLTGYGNWGRVYTQVGNLKTVADLLIQCPADRILEYKIDADGLEACDLSVRGWFI